MMKKPSRNDACPCGSGKKYKQCCLKSQTQTVRHTPDGKFKFSITASPETGSSTKNFTRLFQQSLDSYTPQQEERKNHFSIAKSKDLIGKKAIRKAKAKEERIISERLGQHEFQVMDVKAPIEEMRSSQGLEQESFLPTQEDYRIQKKEDSQDLENS